MPDEINRFLTDQVVDLQFTPSSDGDPEPPPEGVWQRPRPRRQRDDQYARSPTHAAKLAGNGLPSRFALVILYRRSNVDNADTLKLILGNMTNACEGLTIIFSVHPRDDSGSSSFGLDVKGLQLRDLLGYLQFLALRQRATIFITDSGGIQEETTYLEVSFRYGSGEHGATRHRNHRHHTLVGRDMNRHGMEVANILSVQGTRGSVPPLWDGDAGERIAE